jgi:1-acyl-sn-glycerol-3-phosphate acyltransferase
MKRVIISAFIWISTSILMFVLFLAMLFFSIVLFPFDKKRKVAHAQCFWWADAVIWLNPYWTIKVEGLDNIDHKKTYVVVANHLSLADIAVLYKTKMQFKWVAKESLFRIPVLGWCMSLGKHVRLRRGDFSSIKNIYREAAIWLMGGMSVLLFPEGTRSQDGKMQDFQNGAFKLAIKEKVPVLPISIRGTADAIPKGSWLFRTKVSFSIRVMPAIDTASLGPADFLAIRDMARNAIGSR